MIASLTLPLLGVASPRTLTLVGNVRGTSRKIATLPSAAAGVASRGGSGPLLLGGLTRRGLFSASSGKRPDALRLRPQPRPALHSQPVLLASHAENAGAQNTGVSNNQPR